MYDIPTGGEDMYWKTIIMTIVMSLIMGGAALAQQESNQTDGFLGIGGDQQQMEQTYTGVVDQVEDDYFLIVGDRVYQLEVDDEEMVQGMVGQEVEVRGTLEEDTIQAESVDRAGMMQDQPMGGQQPMEGQEGNQTGW
jgi:hypothetical protein